MTLLGNVNAQDSETVRFRKFKCTIGIGAANRLRGMKDNTLRLGMTYFTEPMWQVNNKWSLGVLLQGVSILEYYTTYAPQGPGEYTTNSYFVSSNYRFSDRKVRWYLGMGAGVSTLFIHKTKDGRDEWKAQNLGSRFTVIPSGGVELNRVVLRWYWHFSGRPVSNFTGLTVGYVIGGKRFID